MPPVAVKLTEPQAVVVPVIPAVGTVLTVIGVEVDAVQPLAAVTVTVTVYVPVVVKVLAAVAVLLPVDHE